MGGTKIIVLQMREIIKTAIFALIGLILIIALAYLFIPKDKPITDAKLYIPGTYSAQITLNGSPVNVDVTVGEMEILSIELANMAETQQVFYPLVKPTMQSLAKEIIATQSVDVEVSVDNAMTSKILLDAVRNALSEASIPEA